MSESVKERIIEKEWVMFQTVNGGVLTASCQTKPGKFGKMRGAQFQAWPEEALISYEQDLDEAAKEKRNLLREKYIYMMKNTAGAAQWKLLERELPACSERERELAEQICAQMIEDTAAFRKKYPWLSDAGRPLYKEEDTAMATSIETYEYGELMTYSEKTLELLLAHIRSLKEQGRSFAEEIQKYTFASYGFASLEEANAYLGEERKKKGL